MCCHVEVKCVLPFASDNMCGCHEDMCGHVQVKAAML